MSTQADQLQLMALESQRCTALVSRDRALLETLFSDQLLHVHSTGEQMNKAELLRYVLQVLQFLSVERGPLSLQVRGDVAVMFGSMRTRMQRIDKPDVVSAESLVTQVWVRENGRWQLVNFHACRTADRAKS
jgi:ketosteroid isomerase-like protein